MQKSFFSSKNAQSRPLFVQKSLFPSENAQSQPLFVQKSLFPFENAQSQLLFVQKSSFPFKNAKSQPLFVQKSLFSSKNAQSHPGIAQNQTTYHFHSQAQNKKERKVSSNLLILPSIFTRNNETKLCFTALHSLHYFISSSISKSARARAQLYTCCSIRYSTRRATTTNRPFSV